MQFSLPGIPSPYGPYPVLPKPERAKCPCCLEETRVLRATICADCCTHARKYEKRLKSSLFCSRCRTETATGLSHYKPRTWAERDSDEANDRWHAWFDSMG
jgi:hypothetical protein